MYEIETGNSVVDVQRIPLWTKLIVAAWFCATAIGLWFLWRYASIPGDAGQPVARWPGDSQVILNRTGDTLLMFAHPRCPCTRSSLAELQRVLSNSPKTVVPWIIIYRPATEAAEWNRTDLWNTASELQSAHVIDDPDGRLAQRFHVVTSGETLLYNPAGELLFSGGITSSRGHEGDNAGQTALLELLNGGTTLCHNTPVYGCVISPQRYVP